MIKSHCQAIILFARTPHIHFRVKSLKRELLIFKTWVVWPIGHLASIIWEENTHCTQLNLLKWNRMDGVYSNPRPRPSFNLKWTTSAAVPIVSPWSTEVAPFVHDRQVFKILRTGIGMPQIDPGDFYRARPVNRHLSSKEMHSNFIQLVYTLQTCWSVCPAGTKRFRRLRSDLSQHQFTDLHQLIGAQIHCFCVRKYVE